MLFSISFLPVVGRERAEAKYLPLIGAEHAPNTPVATLNTLDRAIGNQYYALPHDSCSHRHPQWLITMAMSRNRHPIRTTWLATPTTRTNSPTSMTFSWTTASTLRTINRRSTQMSSATTDRRGICSSKTMITQNWYYLVQPLHYL